MVSGVLLGGTQAVKWAVKRIAAKEGCPHPAEMGLLADLHGLAEMVATAPPQMLDSALDHLVSLMSNLPPDAALPILSEIVSRRPDAIEKAIAARTRLGGRVQHIEKAVFVQALFMPHRVKLMTETSLSFLNALHGSEPEMI